MTNSKEFVVEDNRKLLMDRSVSGRIGTTLPLLDVPEQTLPDTSMLRDTLEMIALSLGRSYAYVELIELYTRNADFTKRPRNRGGDAT